MSVRPLLPTPFPPPPSPLRQVEGDCATPPNVTRTSPARSFCDLEIWLRACGDGVPTEGATVHHNILSMWDDNALPHRSSGKTRSITHMETDRQTQTHTPHTQHTQPCAWAASQTPEMQQQHAPIFGQDLRCVVGSLRVFLSAASQVCVLALSRNSDARCSAGESPFGPAWR